jgi:hypothetical protein
LGGRIVRVMKVIALGYPIRLRWGNSFCIEDPAAPRGGISAPLQQACGVSAHCCGSTFDMVLPQSHVPGQRGPYLVSIHKWLFFAISVSICGISCATYPCTHPRNPLILLTLRKNPSFMTGLLPASPALYCGVKGSSMKM